MQGFRQNLVGAFLLALAGTIWCLWGERAGGVAQTVIVFNVVTTFLFVFAFSATALTFTRKLGSRPRSLLPVLAAVLFVAVFVATLGLARITELFIASFGSTDAPFMLVDDLDYSSTISVSRLWVSGLAICVAILISWFYSAEASS